jgi:hypothetical protein
LGLSARTAGMTPLRCKRCAHFPGNAPIRPEIGETQPRAGAGGQGGGERTGDPGRERRARASRLAELCPAQRRRLEPAGCLPRLSRDSRNQSEEDALQAAKAGQGGLEDRAVELRERRTGWTLRSRPGVRRRTLPAVEARARHWGAGRGRAGCQVALVPADGGAAAVGRFSPPAGAIA